MSTLRILAAVGALIAGVAAGAGAQIDSVSALTPGTRVWVWSRATGTEGRRGVVRAISGDTLHLAIRRGRRVMHVAVDSIWRIHVSRSRSRVPGALAGGAVGLALGGGLGWGTSRALAAIFPDCADCVYGPTPEERHAWDAEDRRIARTTGVVAGGAGLVIGAWIGSRYLGDRWERIPTRSRVGIGPTSAGVALSLEIRQP